MNKNCTECDHKLEMHYQLFCPKCDKSVLKPRITKVYDLFKIMYHMEANGYMKKRDFWGKHICENYDVSNDSMMDLNLGFYGWERDNVHEDDLEYFDYLMALWKVLNLTEDDLNNEIITVEISW